MWPHSPGVLHHSPAITQVDKPWCCCRRGQLYSKVETMFNCMFSIAAIGLTMLLAMSYRQAHRRRCALEDADLLQKGEEGTSKDDGANKNLASAVREQVHANSMLGLDPMTNMSAGGSS